MTPNTLTQLAAGAPVQNWLVLGPFVVKTDGHFEREYLYERQRILDIDYLAEDGGEAAVAPCVGQTHRNMGLGPKQLAWFEHADPRIHGTHYAREIIYETVQRNCVFYAAAAIDAESECHALLDLYHSGAKIWVNGELVSNEPHGLPKGIRLQWPTKVIRLKKGRNLLMVKFRPGFIADGIDFTVREVRVAPLAGEPGLPIALGRVAPMPLFTGTLDQPRQVIEAALVNSSHVAVKVGVSGCIRTRCGRRTRPR